MEAMGSEAFLLLSLWCLLGFVFYWRTVKYGMLTEYSGMSTSGTVLFAFLIYTAIMWLGKQLAGKQSVAEIVAMTANAFQEDVNAAIDAGMQAHIAKPIDLSVLTKTLLSILKL